MSQERRPITPIAARPRAMAAAAVAGCLLLGACAAALAAGSGRAPASPPGRGGEAAAPIPAQQAGAGLREASIEVGGTRRDYVVAVPPQALAGRPAPLLMAFHGGAGTADGFVSHAGLLEMADRYGFILVAPQGLRGSWNNGSTTGFANRSGTDDLAFVAALLDEVERAYPVEPGRVFATGVSAGGMMAYHLACDLPGRFKAIAVVAGTLTDDTCPDGAPVSVLHIHGTADENVPLAGGKGQFTARAATYPSVESSLDVFRARDQCGGEAAVSRPASDATCEETACAAGTVVEICTVEGASHGWPGVEPNRRQRRRGAATSDFDATDFIAQFLLSR